MRPNKNKPKESHDKTDIQEVHTAPVYTLAVASRLSKVPAHSIRQYVDKGLLIPYKLASGRHLFSDEDIDRLQHIRMLMREGGLNIAGLKALLAMVPCWKIRDCEQSGKVCRGISAQAIPCWEASEKDRLCRNEDCRTCRVYRLLSTKADIKSLIYNEA